MLKQLLARFYPYEIHLLVGWSVLAVVQKLTEWALEFAIAILALDLIFFYILFDLVIIKNQEDGALVKAFPTIYGSSVALVIIGVSLKILNVSPNPFTTLGMLATLLSCILVFYTPIQDKFLPILKVFLLRTAIVLALGFIFSF